jgi:hypothetical protein
MTIMSVYNPTKGYYDRVIRNDAVKLQDRYYVPTKDTTKWVSNMDEFRAAGGVIGFNEDQTEIELLLPEGYKFSIQMFRAGA